MRPSPGKLYAFTNAIQPVRRAWHQAATLSLARGHGISISIATTVIHLFRVGNGLQQNALAEAVGVNPAAMLRTLDQAETMGLLVRRDVPGNRRIRAVHLTSSGKQVALQMERTLVALRSLLLDGVAESEIEAATNTLRLFEERIAHYLQAERK